MDQIQLRNRLLVATGMWRETTGEPLPKMPPGDPASRSSSSSSRLVDRLWELATPETAREIADRTWDLVHDRPDSDRGQEARRRVPRGARADDSPRRLSRRATVESVTAASALLSVRASVGRVRPIAA